MRLFAFFLLLSAIAGFPKFQSSVKSGDTAPVQSLERKLTYIEQNAALARPSQAPTHLTEQEINAYLASGRVQFPAGVQSLQLQGEHGAITAKARVDFDQVKAGQRNGNPLLSVFSGVHDVTVASHAHGTGHQGFVHVDSVALDGIEIPQFALELFVEKYIQPRYPGIGIDSRFTLPDKIDTATVGQHEVIVTQK